MGFEVVGLYGPLALSAVIVCPGSLEYFAVVPLFDSLYANAVVGSFDSLPDTAVINLYGLVRSLKSLSSHLTAHSDYPLLSVHMVRSFITLLSIPTAISFRPSTRSRIPSPPSPSS